jgi:hypothetical protein
MRKRTIITLAVITGVLAGCAGANPSPEDKASLKKKTAKFFGTTTDNITINNFEEGLVATGYKATYQGTLYNCFEHKLYGYVQCKKPGY